MNRSVHYWVCRISKEMCGKGYGKVCGKGCEEECGKGWGKGCGEGFLTHLVQHWQKTFDGTWMHTCHCDFLEWS